MTQIQRFLGLVVARAAASPQVLAVALIGSHARGTANVDSDVDLIVIVRNVGTCLASPEWVEDFGQPLAMHDEDWGAVTSRRVRYADGLEAEFGFTTTAWVAPPVDAGTAAVVGGGFRVLYDPGGLFSALGTGSG